MFDKKKIVNLKDINANDVWAIFNIPEERAIEITKFVSTIVYNPDYTPVTALAELLDRYEKENEVIMAVYLFGFMQHMLHMRHVLKTEGIGGVLTRYLRG